MSEQTLKPKEHFHGSDLEKIEAIYHIRKEDIVSFSANINPLGISGKLKASLAEHLDAIQTYPDREYTELRRTIAAYAGTVADHVIVGNGSTELISLVIQAVAPKKAMVLAPSYSEYEREISLRGGEIVYYYLQEDRDFRMDIPDFLAHLTEDLDLLVFCNPNNPTSSAVCREDMTRILDVCKERGIFVMVDETYVEFTAPEDEISSIPLTAVFENLVVLRGTSKFFAAPGLRLGYAVTGSAKLRSVIASQQNPWSISSLAEIAGRLMFLDEDYIAETTALMTAERQRCAEVLSKWDSVKIYPAFGNFQLVKILKDGVDAYDLFDHCIKKGLMIRNCSTFPNLSEKFFRFCYMGVENDDRLLEALGELLG